MKKAIVKMILNMEKQRIGKAYCNCIRFNTTEYYNCFELLYETNQIEFSKALSALRNETKDIGDDFNAEMKVISNFCSERIKIHILRLCLYFDIEIEDIDSSFKKLYEEIFVLLRSNNYEAEWKGGWAYFEYTELFRSIFDTNATFKQMFYKNNIPAIPSFMNFISLQNVIDIHSANLYILCARYKLVPNPPKFLKTAVKAANIVDHLIGGQWHSCLFNRSNKNILSEVSILEAVGFQLIPDLIKKIIFLSEKHTFSTKKEKFFFYKKVLNVLIRR